MHLCNERRCGASAITRLPLPLAQVLHGWFLPEKLNNLDIMCILKKMLVSFLQSHTLLENVAGTINNCQSVAFYFAYFTVSWISGSNFSSSLHHFCELYLVCACRGNVTAIIALTHPTSERRRQYLAKCLLGRLYTDKSTTNIDGFMRITFLHLFITHSQRDKGNLNMSATIK